MSIRSKVGVMITVRRSSGRRASYAPLECSSGLCMFCRLLLQLKKDKVELENQLEQEQEALVNRLWKRMDKLEAEKR